MYCSLQEAWPDYNNTVRSATIQPNESVTSTNAVTNANSRPMSQPESARPRLVSRVRENSPFFERSNNITETFDNESNHNHGNCDNFLDHLSSCQMCQKYVSSKLIRNNTFSKLFEMHPQLKETILVFLIGIVILMVLNLLSK
jgi:hypothetical protein